MYNEEIKERYLADIKDSTAPNTKTIFKFSETAEIDLEKDIAVFSLDEIQGVFGTFGFSEPEVVRTRIAALASYADWYCTQFNLPGHHIREYTVDMFPYSKHFAPTVTKTPKELVQKLLRVFPIDSGQPVLGALCLAWLGIDNSDAVRLRTEQVDTKNGKIYSLNGSIIVPEMPECIRNVLEVYGNTREAERTQNKTFTVYAEDYGYFLKRMMSRQSKKEGGPFTTRQLVGYIRDFNFKYKENIGDATALNYTNIQRSGGFYRLHQLDQSGVDIRSVKNADKVRMCLGQSKRNHKDNMRMYDAYLEVIGEKQTD